MARIALGVTGGIGAYKAVEICRGLQKRGHDVTAVMTKSATRFVGPVTFEAITRKAVLTSQWRPGTNADIEHVALADRIDLLLIAPCTANVIGKLANGIADDFLTSLFLATTAPVLLAPAMNSNMLANPAVQQNLAVLASRGVAYVEPGEGYLACGWIGKGRLAEPLEVIEAAERVLRPMDSVWKDLSVLVTAGPTYEDLDAVRYVGNRSSGKMGCAVAREAVRRGARVTLVTGPIRITPPSVHELVRVRSAAEMHDAVMSRVGSADVVIMAAAVADYTPAITRSDKIPKGEAPLTLELVRTADILAALGQLPSRASGRPVLVGFAAETGDATEKARAKRLRKKVDLIVANDVSQPGVGFDSDTNAVTIVGASIAEDQNVPRQSKHDVAAAILDRTQQVIESRHGRGRV